MSMQDGYDPLSKYSVTGKVNIDMKSMKRLPGIDIINECKRIRDDLHKLEGLPPIVNPIKESVKLKTPQASKKNNLYKTKASNLNGTKLDDFLSKGRTNVSVNHDFRVQPQFDGESD